VSNKTIATRPRTFNTRALARLALIATLITCASAVQAAVNDLCINNETETEKGLFIANIDNHNLYSKITYDAGSDHAMRVYNNTGGQSFYIQDTVRYAFTPSGPFKFGGGNWATLSDRRVKKNIQSYSDGLEKLRLVKPHTFNYNGLLQFAPDDGVDQIGVVAQELQQVLPDMVTETSSESVGGNSLLVVDPSNFTFALINAVKEQQQAIEKLRNKTRKLEMLLCAKNPQRSFCK